MTKLPLLLMAAGLSGTVCAAAATGGGGGSSEVLSGLEVTAAGSAVRVAPGRCRIEGQTVEVREPVVLPVEAPGSFSVAAERQRLGSVLADKWGPGNHLQSTISGGTSRPGALVPGSVVMELPDGTRMKEGSDYDLNTTWAAVARRAGGRMTTDSEVVLSYRVGQMRLDAVTVSRDGRVELVKGTPSKDEPGLPEPSTGTLTLARIFMPYHATEVAPWQIFPVGPPFPEPDQEETARRAATVSRTLEKLRKGDPVTIVTWGDSVTVGGDASVPEKRYANRFVTLLRERFPRAKISHVNAGIGGTTTDGRLPALKAEVLDHKPDLVTIEFVNDMSIPRERLRANYASALGQIKSAGAEAILITPHFTMPEWMGHPHPRGKETRPAVGWLREIAAEHGIGLADTARRWEHLEVEGLPYPIFLKNGINHPSDYGHELFVKDLMTFFPAKEE